MQLEHHGHDRWQKGHAYAFYLMIPLYCCQFGIYHVFAYSKLYAHKEEGWELTVDQMLDIVKSYDGKPVTEVHIVGGVHPKLTLEFFLRSNTNLFLKEPALCP